MGTFGFQWHLTDRCNGSCAHCYQDSFTTRGELAFEAWARLADRIFAGVADLGVAVNLTGGEPFLLPDLLRLVEHLHGFDNLEEVNIITNGLVADEGVLSRLSAFPKIGCLKVSLEAGDRAVNDAIRGPGHFAAVRRNLAVFRESARKPMVIMATLSRRNLAAIPGTVAFARDSGLSGVIFERFVPLGTGARMADQALGPAEWAAAVDAIARSAGVVADTEDLAPYRAFWIDLTERDGPELRGALCNLGRDTMALMPDGTVFPCRRLPIPAGDLLAETFEVVRERLARYAVQEIRTRLGGGRCGACGVDDCAGCRALARAIHGDFLGDDPACILAAP